MKMKLFGVITLLTISIVIISGCVGQSPEQVAQRLAVGTQTAKSFLNEYPNAEIVAAYISEENVEDVISGIREKCGEQIELKDYWKVSITDPSTNLNLVIWINAKTQQTVCAIKTGTEYIVSQPKPEQPEVEPTPTALPDLMISSSDVTFSPESPGDGEIVTISVTIHNIGTATAPLVLYNAYDGTELIGYTNAPASLDPGASVTYKFAWKATVGKHIFKVTADPPNQVDEINEDNNVVETSIIVRMTDLTISSSDIVFDPATPLPGQEVYVTWKVHNKGDVNATNFAVRTYDITKNFEISLLTYLSIPAGSSITRTTLWPMHAVTQGNHTIKVIADYYNNISESNEDNNIAERSITVTPASLPDLTISQTDITFSTYPQDIPTTSPVEGEDVIVSVTIHNIGSVEATPVLYSTYDDTSLIGYTNAPASIPAGGSHTFGNVWFNVTGGTHTIRVVVDIANQVIESNEDNNEATTTLAVSAAQLPDIAVSSSDITFSPASPTAGESVTINATIYNLGSAQASGIFYNIYDMTLNKMIGYNNVPLTLAAGASTTVSHMWWQWQNVTAGTHTIRVTLDYSDVITESDETNNIAEKNVIVS